MAKKGLLIVVSGFSGTGKGTVLKKLMSEKENYVFSVSATTRGPREGEVDGREYFFVSDEKFQNMIAEDAFLEYACYVKHSYGTPKQYVFDQMVAGKDVLLDIEIQGALNVKKQYPEAMLVFLIPPSAESLKNRLVGRGTEEWLVIRDRLRRAAEEADAVSQYDYVLVNDDLDLCVEQLHSLITCQHFSASNYLEDVKKIQNELKEIVEGE